jgi:ATP-dependent RNA helicase RhlE
LKNFETLKLNKQIVKSILNERFKEPTPIQEAIIPPILNFLDVIGIAQTGTGKTAAYMLPLIHNITKDKSSYEKRCCKSLVLLPTRELATQVYENAKKFSKFLSIRVSLIVGGMKPAPQLKSVEKGVDIIIATPGRLLDHVNTKGINLVNTSSIVLDEADQMLDLGFFPAIKRVYKNLPKKKQSVFISATMLKPVRALANEFLINPEEINLSPRATPIKKIRQRLIFVNREDKLEKLADVIEKEKIYQAIIFTKTKIGADKLALALKKTKIKASALHGDKRQGQRNKILKDFKKGELNFLVATDVAARGIDIEDISFVINYDMPMQAEIYVHRVGRTARAGKSGVAISFCDRSEIRKLKEIENLIGYTFEAEGIEFSETKKDRFKKNDKRPRNNFKKKRFDKKEGDQKPRSSFKRKEARFDKKEDDGSSNRFKKKRFDKKEGDQKPRSSFKRKEARFDKKEDDGSSNRFKKKILNNNKEKKKTKGILKKKRKSNDFKKEKF